ncbi:MAG: hypothetical protein C0399_02865 [Syntrophus sp. (in: bacteria)]|nr:hypothetical protein [Syntrophus sp. (in: bacteria)]
MDIKELNCINDPAFRRLQCHDTKIVDGILLENHLFLISLLPCCAQLALPYWAKITGRIMNQRTDEVLLNIMVTLFDDCGSPLTDYTDMIALESGEKGEFEVKLVEYHDRAKTYTILIEETKQL